MMTTSGRRGVRGKPVPMSERFADMFIPEPMSGCWLWLYSVGPGGYGQIMDNDTRRPKIAHRLSWELHRGAIPDGLGVLHRCDNPPCVNPDHLFLGTQTDNMRDCSRKGRSRNGQTKLTPVLAEEIRAARQAGSTLAVLAQRFSVSPATICAVVRGHRWRATA